VTLVNPQDGAVEQLEDRSVNLARREVEQSTYLRDGDATTCNR
jgi:hypothetical protein